MVHLPPSVKVPSMCDKVIMIIIVIGQYLHKVFMLGLLVYLILVMTFIILSSDCCCCCFSTLAGHYKEGKRAFVVLLVSSA